MRSKRLLTILIAACLLISTLSPAVFAAQTAGGSSNKFVTTDKASNGETGLVASPDAAGNVSTLKDDALVSSKLEAKDTSKWSYTEIEDLGAALLPSETPDCLDELKEAAEYFDSDDKVVAFVVIEDKPLAEVYTNIQDVSAAARNKLLSKQDTIIETIEEDVLDQDEELEVRYQFTYLTNAFSIETQFENLAEIAKLENVKSVFIMPVYDAITTKAPGTANPLTASSGEMTGVSNVWGELGYTGTGMKIAVIDTGLDLDHPSFAADPETNDMSMTADDIAAVLTELNAYDLDSSITAEDLYRTAKVPYAFNYVDENLTADHSMDSQGDHGTHVSGIAAANRVEGTSVVGMAPDAQLIVMKVFGANGGAYTDDIVAALEDAMTLGCDVVNASLGSPAGFASSDTEIDQIYERLADQDIVATISAGNEGTSSYGNMWGTDLNRTNNPDNATVGSPSTYVNALSIASAENAKVMTNYFTIADGSKIFYIDSVEYLYGETSACMANLEGQELEYVIVPGLGSAEDFAQVDVAGKVAIVMRGELSFAEKVFNAEYNGAVACVIWNNNDTDDIFSFGMTTATEDGMIPSIPSCLISLSDGTTMEAAETKTIAPTSELGERVANGGQMSSFSSWGVSPDLQLVPDITGIGGNVYSCYDGGGYGLMSGTSMSAPQVAGVTALVMQYLHEQYPDAADGEIRALAEALMMSTADPIVSTVSGVEASPRQQGAGLVDAYEATTTKTYLTVDGGRPKAELGDHPAGMYSFSFEIHNMGDTAKTYTLSSSLLTEDIIDYGIGEYFMAGVDMALSGTVSFDADTVTVPAGGTATVNVSIALSDEDKAYFDQYWEDGGYVEGYVYLTNEEGAVELNLPYLGFVGDWSSAATFDTAFWYDNSFWGLTPEGGLPEGDQYYHVMWTSLAGSDWVLGINPYSGAIADENGNVIYSSRNNAISPNGDGVLDGLSEMYLSLMRNAKTLTFTYWADGELLHSETITNASKTMYISAYGQVVPWIYSWYGEGLYDFTDAEGNPLPNGTEVMLNIEAKLDYESDMGEVIEIPIYIDNEGAQIVSAPQEEVLEDGTAAMTLEVDDNVSVAAVFLMNQSGTQIYGTAYDTDMTLTENGTYTVSFDVTGLGTELVVAVCDYAGNERYYDVSYNANGENLPAMNTDSLYAYRVYDNYIMSDHMYGWIEMNKPASAEDVANISVWTDDYLEYAAINAAEYVDGKIFAVDAVYNLVVMDPGLFNRQHVTNLGVNVLDMTFDDSTDTMYVLSKQDYDIFLYTMDLLTGELTLLNYCGYSYNAPWAIADDDNGTLYAIMYNSASIYTLDVAGGTYDMTAVADAEGNPIVFTDSWGEALAPSANSQSITYQDGKLYWAYFKDSYYGGSSDLITIDTADWSHYANPYMGLAYDYDYNLVEYYPTSELVGLLTLNETDYQIPASDAAISIGLSSEQLILATGASEDLSVSWLPWNYELDKTQLTWTSSDESVATVTDGTVTAVGEGSATITVSYGDLTASCNVSVVEIEGHFEAYNYYTADGYYGYMIDVDMETMDYTLVGNLSPVDFLAGDYNGHDGYFYGYDIGGQLYRYDYETGDAVAIGASMGTYPVDMAYDYSSGLMYVLVLDSTTYQNTLYVVNMNNGALMEMGTGMGLMNLACTTDGTLYAMDAYGYLNLVTIEDLTMYGQGYYLNAMPVMEEPFGDLYLLGSMCWDHNNQVLLWNWAEAASIVWMDVNAAVPYYVNLGDPSESGVVELTGMHVVPNEIPALADVAVESVTAEDMLILTGYEKVPAVTVAPFNATSQELELTVADPSIAEFTESGSLKGLSAGETTVTAKLSDTVSGVDHEVTFNVTVMDGADNLYGHLLTDIATYNAQAWIELYPGTPSVYDTLGYFYHTIFTQEYVDGKLYTYGYDAADWEANWEFFVLNAETYAIETQINMGESFPYIYDMTYDYTTSTMYALAGSSEDNTDLYVVDMETGAITLLMKVDPLLMAIAATPDGKLYAIENSVAIFDEWDPWAAPVLGNAQLHVIDPLEGTMEYVGDTGLKSTMISSMTYDYDTDTLYWSAFAEENGSYLSNLAIVNTETGLATSLGTIGVAGAQVGGLYAICDSFPVADNSTLHNLIMPNSKMTVGVGASASISVLTMPSGLDAEIAWSSDNEYIATVDENGVVTGLAQGVANVTATVTYNGVTRSATCAVAVLDDEAAFLTYNTTDSGWSLVSRNDYTVVTNLTEGVDETAAIAVTYVGEDVYGYDENNQLFKLNTETFERTNIGDGLGLEVAEDCQFVVKDMAYDEAGDRVLVLGDTLVWDDYWMEYGEVYGGCGVYAVDLVTGALELLYTFDAHNFVYAMDVGTEGEIYLYNTFDDGVDVLDLTTGTINRIITLQSQSLYGDMYCDYSLFYDELTDVLYMLFTGNGNFYKMLTIDATLGTLTDNGYVGTVEMVDWAYMGDIFRGLTFANICKHPVVEYVLTLNEDGTITASTLCGVCDEIDETAVCEIVSEEITKEATCTEDGTKVYTVNLPNGSTDTLEVIIEATGHNFVDGACTVCGELENPVVDPTDPTNPSDPTDPSEPADPSDPTDPDDDTPDTGDHAQMDLWIALLVMALSGMVALFTVSKKWMKS